MSVAHADSAASVSWVEHQTLEHIKGALLVTLDWRAPAVGQARRKSSIAFTLQSFCRHLERVMAIEEHDGYLEVVTEANPCLEKKLRTLGGEHDQFRARMRDLALRLEAVEDWDNEGFDDVCTGIRQLLADVSRHDQAEVRLLQETLTCDEGGEG
ncbi:MAG: hemerythrin domain-containing protein [Planctomycetota bacterium]